MKRPFFVRSLLVECVCDEDCMYAMLAEYHIFEAEAAVEFCRSIIYFELHKHLLVLQK